MVDITVQKYRSGDEEEIVNLLDEVFNDWPKIDLKCSKIDHWIWKYVDRPYQILEASLAFHGEKLVGCIHANTVNLKLKNNIYLSEPKGDLAVHPDYRGKGVWRAMLNAWHDNKWSSNLINYNHSGNQTVINRAKARKAQTFPSPVKHMCRIQDIKFYLEAKDSPNLMIKRMGYLGLTGLSKIRTLVKQAPIHEREYSVNTIQEFDGRINDFWEKISPGYDFIVERKRNYLNWRYCDPRGGDYTVRLVEDDHEIVGYSILRINRYISDYPEGYVVDLVTKNGDFSVAESLLGDACRIFDENGVNAVHYWVPRDHFTVKILDRLNFVDSQREILVYFGQRSKPELLEMVSECDPEKSFFQLGDLDSI